MLVWPQDEKVDINSCAHQKAELEVPVHYIASKFLLWRPVNFYEDYNPNNVQFPTKK